MNSNEIKLLSTNAVVLKGEGEDLEILLIKRQYPPFAGEWGLPGGFVKNEESSLDCCIRKVKKETNLDLDPAKKIDLDTRSASGRDPRGLVLSQCYMFYLNGKKTNKEVYPGEGISNCQWLNLKNVPSLAFDHGALLCQALGMFWSFMPSAFIEFSKIPLPRFVSPKEITFEDSITFFGGTFNPWHEGHSTCLDLCPSKNIVVVLDTNPWKQNDDFNKNCFWKAFKEIALEFEKSNYAFYPGFFGKENSNPTVGWLPITRAKNKEILMGEDNFAKFLSWKDYKILIRSLKRLYIVPRKHNNALDGELESKIKSFNKYIVIEHLPSHPFEEFSSTEMREKLESNTHRDNSC